MEKINFIPLFIYFALPLKQGWNALDLPPVIEGCMGFLADSTVKRDMKISRITSLADAYMRGRYRQQVDQPTHTPM